MTETTAVIAPVMAVNAKYRPLWCETCRRVTTFTLNGDIYECDCGAFVEYVINVAKPMYAIELRESAEAQQRFAELEAAFVPREGSAR